MYCFLACICTAMLKQATTLAFRKWSCVPWRLSTATHQVRLVEFTDRILRVVLLVHLDPFLHRVLTNLNHVVEPLLPSPETTATCKTTKLWNKEREVCEKTVAKGKHCRYIPYGSILWTRPNAFCSVLFPDLIQYVLFPVYIQFWVWDQDYLTPVQKNFTVQFWWLAINPRTSNPSLIKAGQG